MKDKNGHCYKDGDKIAYGDETKTVDLNVRVRNGRVQCNYTGNPQHEGVAGWIAFDACAQYRITARADGHPPGPVMPDGHEVRPGDRLVGGKYNYDHTISA